MLPLLVAGTEILNLHHPHWHVAVRADGMLWITRTQVTFIDARHDASPWVITPASKLSLLTLSVCVKRHIFQWTPREFRVREYERGRRLCTGNNAFLSSFPGLGCSFSIPVRRRSAGKAQVGSSKAASRTSTLFCSGKAASRNLVQNFNCRHWG